MSNYNIKLQNNNVGLQEVLEILQNKAAGGEQTTPVISINTSGLITATAGTKSATKQLAFQPAKTITPSKEPQIAVSNGYYVGGNIIIDGDANLVAGNIKSGVSIFGVSGTLTEGSGSGNTDDGEAIITRNIVNYTNNNVVALGRYAFAHCDNLTTVSLPVCRDIGSYAFAHCINLREVSFPACKYIIRYAFTYCNNLRVVSFPVCSTIDEGAFSYCIKLTTVSFPMCTRIESYAFYNCTNLTAVSFPMCTRIGSYAFANCYFLSSFTLGASSVCSLDYSNIFSSTPYAGYSAYFSGTPHIYVPASLVEAYKSATNWAYFSNYFRAIGDEDSGSGEGSDGNIGNLITFSIDDISYNAEEGMTWSQWCNSDYNEAGLVASGTLISNGQTGFREKFLLDQNFNHVSLNDVIIKEYNYMVA